MIRPASFERTKQVKQQDQNRILSPPQEYIKVTSMVQALHRHIPHKPAQSCKAFLETEKAAAAVPFMF